MKSVHLTAEHEAFRQSVRHFLQTEVAPHAEEWETSRRIPREVFRKMGELGFLGTSYPEAYSGAGGDVFFTVVFLEELARSLMGGFCAAVTVQALLATVGIERRGSEELKQRYLVPSIQGKRVGAIAISEPDTGSDVAAIRTSAVRDGGVYLINGAKTWITNGVYGDFYVVACKTDKDAGAGGISLIAMDADLPGIKTSKLRKMGWHSSDTAEIFFEDVRVPLSGLVGEENQGFYYIMDTFALERLAAAATSVGACDVALEATLKYMAERHAFGKPLSKFQALRHRLADLFAELEAVRALVYHAAWLVQQEESGVREAAMAKLLATELNKRVADECVQFHGGYGYVEEYAVERFYRDARVSTIVAGTSEIMREIIAKTDIDGVRFAKTEDRERAKPVLQPEEPAATLEPSSPVPMPPPAPAPAPVPPAAPVTLADFFRSLPSRLRADRTADWSSRFHFKLKNSTHPEWTVVIDGPRCEVLEGLVGPPSCVVATSEDVYLGIENGTQNPQTAFLMGKVKISNVAEMMRYVKSFTPAVPR